MLTDTAVRKLKPSDKPTKVSDERGLFLLVTPTGSKLWRWKYRFDGKEKSMSFGEYPDTSLAQAREAREAARKMLAAGADPMANRKAEKVARQFAVQNSFAAVARRTAITRMALKLIAMTFVRTTELIAARWEEFDLDAARWDIPAARMKMRTPHIVPLSKQVVSLLRTLHLVTGHGPMLFPGERDHEKPMSNNTLLKALERMGYKHRMTGHGFRGIASTLLHEMGFEHAHIELQLAHQERNAVSASYNHALYLAPRAKMMQAWSDYLDACGTGKVLAFKRKTA